MCDLQSRNFFGRVLDATKTENLKEIKACRELIESDKDFFLEFYRGLANQDWETQQKTKELLSRSNFFNHLLDAVKNNRVGKIATFQKLILKKRKFAIEFYKGLAEQDKDNRDLIIYLFPRLFYESATT